MLCGFQNNKSPKTHPNLSPSLSISFPPSLLAQPDGSLPTFQPTSARFPPAGPTAISPSPTHRQPDPTRQLHPLSPVAPFLHHGHTHHLSQALAHPHASSPPHSWRHQCVGRTHTATSPLPLPKWLRHRAIHGQPPSSTTPPPCRPLLFPLCPIKCTPEPWLLPHLSLARSLCWSRAPSQAAIVDILLHRLFDTIFYTRGFESRCGILLCFSLEFSCSLSPTCARRRWPCLAMCPASCGTSTATQTLPNYLDMFSTLPDSLRSKLHPDPRLGTRVRATPASPPPSPTAHHPPAAVGRRLSLPTT
jgi:hypothetical protein